MFVARATTEINNISKELLDELKKEAEKEPFKETSKKDEDSDEDDPKIMSDSESFRFKRPIYPWPMPCKDGKMFEGFPERTKLIRISKPEIPSTQKIEEMIEFVNPYAMPKPPPKFKPRPCGLPKYKMVVKPLVTLQLLYSDERGNKFQFAPSPQYNPFG